MKAWHHVVVFLTAIAAIFWRRPDALLNPQFYAEDGTTWFADAWNTGWLHSLTIPAGGYLNTLPRLLCGLAILVPLKFAPLLLNWFGIVIQALPVSILLTRRCENWGPLWLRAAQGALYIALPNSDEINVTITNAHWHLVLVACLLAFANPPANTAWRVFDVIILLLVGLTGPWALVLTPLLIIFWWYRRQPWSLVGAAILAACALIQCFELLTDHGGRPTSALGASFSLFTRLIAGQIYMGAIWGQNLFDLRGHIIPILLIFAAGTTILIYGLLKLPLEMKLFLAFAILITAAALRSPLIFGEMPRWQALAIDKGARYWFFPMLALVWSLLRIATQNGPRTLRYFSYVCLGLLCLRAIPHDWHYWPYKDAHFGTYLRAFDDAPPKTKVAIPIVPVGHVMTLTKK